MLAAPERLPAQTELHAGRPAIVAQNFSADLPAQWHQLPQAALDEFNGRLAKEHPELRVPPYVAAVQRDNPDQWFTYPYILVQELRTGKLDEVQLNKLKDLGALQQETGKKVGERLESALSSLEVTSPVLDRASKTIWSSGRATVPPFGVVSTSSATLLTSFGAVQCTLYAPEKQFSELVPVFTEFVKNLQLDAKVRY